MKLNLIAGPAKKIINFATLKARKYAPEILVGVGIAGVIGGTILACKQTLKTKDILEEHNDLRDTIEYVSTNEEIKERENYTDEDRKKDIARLYIRTGLNLAKNYASSAAIMTTSIACILTGFGILKSRNASLVAAYNAATQAMKAYRDRVKNAIGEDKEGMIFSGAKELKIDKIEIDENGEVKTEKQKKDKVFTSDDPSQYSRWARFFDEVNNDTQWHHLRGNAQLIKDYLITRNNTWEYELHARGVVFMNDIYKDFDWPIVQDGWKYGWVDDGNTHIDFGIYSGTKSSIQFANGYTNAVLLDFNPTYIYDKFEKYQNI